MQIRIRILTGGQKSHKNVILPSNRLHQESNPIDVFYGFRHYYFFKPNFVNQQVRIRIRSRIKDVLDPDSDMEPNAEYRISDPYYLTSLNLLQFLWTGPLPHWDKIDDRTGYNTLKKDRLLQKKNYFV